MIKENCYWYEYDNDMGARIPYCKIHGDNVLESCDNCEQYHSKYETTKADVFRAMSDEELVEFLFQRDVTTSKRLTESLDNFVILFDEQRCKETLLKWLRSPADKEKTNG